MFRHLGFCVAFTVVFAPTVLASAPKDHLEKVVIVQRHGVRSPTKTDTELSQYSKEPWRKWTVAPGELTVRGTKGAEAMGREIGNFYRAQGLLHNTVQDVFVWSDSADTRTVQSGDAVARGLHYSNTATHSGKTTDPLFSAHDAGICPPARSDIERALKDSANHPIDIRALGATYEKAKASMAQLLYPGIDAKFCATHNHAACTFVTGENTLKGEGWDTKLTGPLATGSSLSENLLLEYAEGFSAPGWGRATASHINDIMALHNIYSRLMRSNQAIASRRGAALAQSIADHLSDTPSRFDAAAPVPTTAKLIIYLGHDGNLSNMAGIYGLRWKLPGQPDDTAPNSALAFERWRDGQGRPYVRLRIFYQGLEEQRRNDFPAAGTRVVSTPDCGNKNKQCTLPAFLRLTQQRIEKQCLVQKST